MSQQLELYKTDESENKEDSDPLVILRKVMNKRNKNNMSLQEAIFTKIALRAANGDIAAARLLFPYVLGLPSKPQSENGDGENIVFVSNVPD